ncbi:MAG: ATP-binding cassette domain-containing protein, partial [Gorillibacterium sp.]|nr:ATP-binding cassette domain-containing protein [Gorillibacterium sp.]
MSEEILKALTQLFAIISKQDDGVTEEERDFVIRFFQQELDQDSIKEYVEFFDQVSGYNVQGTEEEAKRLTSVKDSVRTLGICRKINKTLTQKQKIIVLIRLLEMVGSEKNFTAQAMEIINTVATVFNIGVQEYKLIETFVTAKGIAELNSPDLRVIETMQHDHATTEQPAEGRLIFMILRSVSTYFVKYEGKESNMLNGFIMHPNRVYLFSHGSTVKTTSGDAVYYSDLVAFFNKDIQAVKLSFNANIEEFKFASGAVGLRNVLIAEGPGNLIGIMGASGAGKTTLLNVLAGLEKPSKGEIVINGLDIHAQKDKIHGVIGYVAQDDLLIEELTVYQNLYFNARLCFADYSEEKLHQRVIEVLENLGLEQRKDLKVGSVLDKTISGGQRKRLNIALELIREPAILFLDEPTSGLSSRDSENVIDLLKELSLKGKLIFVVIHQPSSDIYKMFDKMIIMDTGGYPAYYGMPVEAIRYFKKATHQVDSNRGQCEVCANVNPEQIFNIIEAKVVDEYGQAT